MNNGLDPLAIQFGLLHDCIRACIYADYIIRKEIKHDAWWSIADMCYADAVTSWNCIFGANSQESHWKKFVSQAAIPQKSNLKPFSRGLLVQHLGISESVWGEFWKSMTDVRNKEIAHIDPNHSFDHLPNTTLLLHSACCYRDWLIALMEEQRKSGKSISFEGPTNTEVIHLFKTQIKTACK
jgi:hypothetical protein